MGKQGEETTTSDSKNQAVEMLSNSETDYEQNAALLEMLQQDTTDLDDDHDQEEAVGPEAGSPRLGATALLDELLNAPLPGQEGQEEAGGRRGAPATLPFSPSPRAEEGPGSGASQAQGPGLDHQPDDHGGLDDDPAVSPLSKEIQDLHSEMENYIGSLGNWEEESRRSREEMKRKLAEQYGFSYEEALECGGGDGLDDFPPGDGEDGDQDDGDAAEGRGEDHEDGEGGAWAHRVRSSDDFNNSEPLGAENPEGRGNSGRSLGEGTTTTTCGAAVVRRQKSTAKAAALEPFPGNEGSMAGLREDEERLAKLKAELEELRKRDGFGAGGARGGAPAAVPVAKNEEENSEFGETLPDADFARLLNNTATTSVVGEGNADLNSTLGGLSAWCDEIDAALRMPEGMDLGDEEDKTGLDATQLLSDNIGDIETRLQEARLVVGKMEGVLESACGRMNEQLDELDRLQAECDEFHAKMKQREEDLQTETSPSLDTKENVAS